MALWGGTSARRSLSGGESPLVWLLVGSALVGAVAGCGEAFSAGDGSGGSAGNATGTGATGATGTTGTNTTTITDPTTATTGTVTTSSDTTSATGTTSSTNTGSNGTGTTTSTGTASTTGTDTAWDCAHSECDAGEALNSGCSDCANIVCTQVDPNCCLVAWNQDCADEVPVACAIDCN